MTFPNPADEQAVREGLDSAHPERLATRHLLYLLGHFDRPDELLERTGGFLQAAGSIQDTVPPKPGRYFCRVRIADASGAVSEDGAILPIVLRVPSTAAMPTPVNGGASVTGGTLLVDVALDPDPELAWAIVFARAGPITETPPDPRAAQLLRMPNRRDLYPEGGLRLRLADGTLLSPSAASVTGPGVLADGQGRLNAQVEVALLATAADVPRQVQWGATRFPGTASPRGRWAPTRCWRGDAMSALSALAALDRVDAAVAEPIPVPDLPATPTVPVAGHPRFAGDLVQWVRVLPGGQIHAAFSGARVVYDGIVPGVPGDTTAPAALIQITPLPRDNAGLLGRLLGGAPVQYAWIAAADLSAVASPGDEVAVMAGDVVAAVSGPAWVGLARQDRIWRDARAWVDELNAAAAGAVDVTWGPWRDRIRQLVPATIKVLDHVGRPLGGGSFVVSDAAGNHPVAPTAASHGDTGIEVTAAGVMITAQGSASGDPAVVVASGTVDAGQVAAPLALTPTDRHVMVLRLDRWLAPRSAGVTGLPRWTTGNTLEPILDGSPYFARLVPDLRAAKNGGAVGLAGWAFVKDGLLDPSKPWSLLPEDNSTELIPLLDELIKGNAAVRILANQFLQLSEADLQGLQVDAAVALTLALMLLMPAWAFGKVQFDPIGGSRPSAGGRGRRCPRAVP